MKKGSLFPAIIGIVLCISMLIFPAVFAADGELNETLANDSAALTAESLLTIPAFPGDAANTLLDDLSLPTAGAGGSEISWISGNEAVISNTGIVTRTDTDESVTLTAVLAYNGEQAQKEFTFSVPAKNTRVNGMPAVGEVKQVSDFGGETPLTTGPDPTKDKIQPNEKGGTVTAEGGKLKLKRTIDGKEENSAYFSYPATSGDFVTEFVMARDAGQAASIKMWGSANHIWLDWYASGEMVIYISDTEGIEGTAYTIPYINFDSQTRAKITLAVNASRGTISMWINNRLAVFDKYPYKFKTGTPMTSSGTTVYNMKSALSAVYIEKYRMYTTDFTPAEDAVNADCDALQWEDLYVIPPFADGSVIDNLNLPRYGRRYSPITWSSDKPEVIAPDGTVNPGGRTENVTLTATIGQGKLVRAKTFAVAVAGQNQQPGLPAQGVQKNANDFNSTISSSVLKLNSTGGWTRTEHGALKLCKTDTSQSTPNAYYLYSNDNQTAAPASGVFVTEFTVRKDDLVKSYFKTELWHSGSGSAVTLEWQQGGLLSGYDGGTWMKFGQEEEFGIKDNTLKFSLLVNEARQTYSLWINNKTAVRNMTLRNATSGRINGITFYNGSGASGAYRNEAGSITITDYCYYTSSQGQDYDWKFTDADTPSPLKTDGEGSGKMVFFSASGGVYYGTESPRKARIILAAEDGTGTLVGVDVKEYDFSAGAPLELSCSAENAESAAVYIWSADGSLVPLAETAAYY